MAFRAAIKPSGSSNSLHSLSCQPSTSASHRRAHDLAPQSTSALLQPGTLAKRFFTSKMLSLAPLSPRKLLQSLSIGPLSTDVRAQSTVSQAIGTQQEQLLLDFICSGPLLELCGLTRENVAESMASWIDLGSYMCKSLSFPSIDQLDDVQRLRVFHYYLPVFFWVQSQLTAHRAAHSATSAPSSATSPPPPPLVLGVSAPQGCGKSTLCEQLVEVFEYLGVRAASVSVDDFYLTNADQRALAESNPSNALLELRGNAGSHDLDLGTATLRTLTQQQDGGKQQTVALPRYDKSAFQGRGDRAAKDAWPTVQLPVDIVLFEGWMFGFRPQPQEQVTALSPDLAPVNDALRSYEAAWDKFVDSWLVIRVSDPAHVYGWRAQAEKKMREAGRPGMSDEQVKDFVDRYMPAYRAYLPSLYAQGPTTARPGHLLVVEVDGRRAPVAEQPERVM